MSRSFRHTPIAGNTTARSEKLDKRDNHKRWRARVRQALFREDENMPHEREVSNPWSMAKDGKHWWLPFLSWRHRDR